VHTQLGRHIDDKLIGGGCAALPHHRCVVEELLRRLELRILAFKLSDNELLGGRSTAPPHRGVREELQLALTCCELQIWRPISAMTSCQVDVVLLQRIDASEKILHIATRRFELCILAFELSDAIALFFLDNLQSQYGFRMLHAPVSDLHPTELRWRRKCL
jgi:hypothetical protein